MQGRTLRNITAGLALREISGDAGRTLTGIAYDSRDVGEGSLFVALDGLHTDGHLFIEDAVRRGAAGVVHSRPVPARAPGVGYALVDDTRAVLSPLSAAFFGRPSLALGVVGVTGTDGKSSTVSFIHQLLLLRGRRAGFLSTVSFHTGEREVKNPFRQSTPEAPELQGMLADMASLGVEFAVVEATSHGLSERTGRLADVLFDAAVMTNVTHEHLEFHGTFEQYRSDKANLFRALDRPAGKGVGCPRFGVVNADDPSAAFFRACTGRPVHSYGLRSPADLTAREIVHDLAGSSFILCHAGRAACARIPIPGPFWVENALAACLAAAHLLGEDPLSLAELLPRLAGVRGRMESVDLGQPFSVIVDYAHTPAAFAKLLPWVRARTPGRVITVFGSAGERDRAKRPLQGRAAADHSDILVLTDEDPRGEDPKAILEEIAAGCPERRRGEDLFLEPDRRVAIALAFSRAARGDAVLLLGKGHEGSIIEAAGSRPYDERGEAERCLRAAGFGRG